MKTLFKNPMVLIMAMVVCAGITISSCDDDDNGTKPLDKTVLQDSIAVAKDLLADTEGGINDGQYPAEARTSLQAAITAAEGVSASTTVKQTEVNNAISSLHQAMKTYREAVIAPVAEADLIGHWAFDEGIGTVAADHSANGFDGEFKTGPEAWGAGFPEWDEDRHGEAGKAIHFNEGANIEIPYNANLNPSQISIALWVNADEVNAGNRFLGLHSWIGYKFQLQEANRPFFTVNVGDATYDRDAEVNLPINEWHHIAVTFGGGSTTFYIDGDPVVKTWNDTPGEAVSISDNPYNLVFGQDFPTDKYAATTANFDNDKIIPLEWGGYFRGYLDEIRIYKTVLSASQIKSVYDREKP